MALTRLSLAFFTPAVAPQTGTAAVSGAVIDAVSGQPVPEAVVSLVPVRTAPGPLPRRVQSADEHGRFVFPDLPAARYTITAARIGYFDGAYGATEPASEADISEVGLRGAIVLGEGQWVADATVRLWRPGALSGTVRDEGGAPVVGVFVQALSLVSVAGREYLAVGPVTATDDRGEYRIHGLAPGRYIAMVPVRQNDVPAPGAVTGSYPVPPPTSGGQPFAYLPAFSSPVASLSAVSALEPGVEQRGLDIRLAPSLAFPIAGRVLGPAEEFKSLTLRLLAEGIEGLGHGSEVALAPVAPDGSFLFPSVPEGRYTIDSGHSVNEFSLRSFRTFQGFQLPRSSSGLGNFVASARPDLMFLRSGGTGSHWAHVPVAVQGAPLSDVEVALRPSLSLSGRVIVEQVSTTPRIPPRLELQAADGDPRLGRSRLPDRPNDAGEFVIPGVLPGRYLIGSWTAAWMVKSVTAGGRDYTDRPIDTTTGEAFTGLVVTVTDAYPSIAGVVRDDRDGPTADAVVLAFPVDRERWMDYGLTPARIKTTPPDTAGEYRLQLPAGTYHVIALPASRARAWQESGFFEAAAPAATTVTIDWGEQARQDLRVRNGP